MDDKVCAAIAAESQRVEESAKCSSEAQFEYAKRWRRADRLLAGFCSAAAAVAGVGILAELIGMLMAGVIALIASALGAVSASLGAPQTKEKAAGSANAYRALQQDARIFRTVVMENLSEPEATERLGSLVERLQDLNAQSEIPSRRAWNKAKRQIEQGSQHYEVDGNA